MIRVVSYRNSTSNHNNVLYNTIRSAVVSYRNSTSNHNGSYPSIVRRTVVSYRNSTSNHNTEACFIKRAEVVSYRNSTSNHNVNDYRSGTDRVVSYRNSTSNHNNALATAEALSLYLIEILHQTTTFYIHIGKRILLYLIEILHQTTTFFTFFIMRNGCILSKFYIKPQQSILSMLVTAVVSYRNSTSNHNFPARIVCKYALYLIEILHQTTTQ